MSDLENTKSLFLRIFSKYKHVCPLCKLPMTEDEDDYIVALRIRDSYENRKKYGEHVIRHPFNEIYVCNTICKERVARAWERPDSQEKRDNLIKSIINDIKAFKESSAKAQMSLYLPRKKRKL